jgi:hypothetical protein
MATSRRIAVRYKTALTAVMLLGAMVLALTTAFGFSGSRAPGGGARTSGVGPGAALSWLQPGTAPATWASATIASGGATLFYPTGWKPIPGDSGTVTEALRDSRGVYHGYLNATPRQGAEQLRGWTAFRTGRNRDEGDTRVHAIAAAEDVSFGDARASCVIDDYRSRVGSHPYREVACLIAGDRYTNVFVGAALVSDWPRLGGLIERAATALRER